MRSRYAFPRTVTLAALLAAALTPMATAQEKLPPGRTLAAVEVFPKEVQLKHPFDYRQLLVTGTLDTGERVDVTRMAAVAAPAVVKVTPAGQVRPAADGDGVLKLSVGDKTLAVPVKVSGQKAKYEVSFVRDVMPSLSKMGCNAGTCHGAAKGKNGFQLSLRGYDPAIDHLSLTDDIMARRFNRAAPDRSLMLMKPSGEAPHVGGVVTKPGEPYYELIRSWIADGVKFDAGSPRVKALEILPKSPTLPLPGMKQQMVVVATYTDGSVRDVSAEAFVESSNTEIATVDKAGLVTAVRRGETAMLARYEGAYAAAPLLVMGDRTGFAWQPAPEYNWIDGLVYEKLKEVKVLPSDVCTDTEFLRRVYLDLTGLPPTPEEVRAFLADNRPSREKREALVDRLVGSPEYVEHWTNKWADLLQVNATFLGPQGAQKYRDFIRKAVADNMPYDQFARAVLTASGSNMDNPAAAYWKILRAPEDAMENTTHLFLAVRFNCNKCHDHPFERWTQSNYYELSSFFAQVQRKEDPRFKGQKIGGTAVSGPVPLVEVIADIKAGEVKNERTGQPAATRFPFTHPDLAPPTAPRREQLARWITSKENPYFARSYANRVWSYLLGVGLIEPVDDIRAGNPATNPKLLDRLTKELIDSNFNVQHLVKVICKSRTYQHAITTNKWNADDETNYSHALARRLPAEVLYDSIHRVTGTPSRLPGLPPGSRAALLVDPNARAAGGFLDLLGRPPRESACECERSNAMLLGPILNLVNGPVVADAIKDPGNRITRLLAAEKDDAKVIEELYLAVLNRPPTKRDLEIGLEVLRDPKAKELHAAMVAEHARLSADLEAYLKQLDAGQPAFEESLKRQPVWTVLSPDGLKAKGAKLTKQSDNSVLAEGDNPTPEVYTVTANTDVSGITAVRLELLTDGKLPSNGPGRAPNGNFVLSEFRMEIEVPGQKTKKVVLGRATADFSQPNFEVQKAIDNNPGTGWAIAPALGKPHVAVFELKEKLPAGGKLTFTLQQNFDGKLHNVGKFRLAVTTSPPPVSATGLPTDIADALKVEPAQRTQQQKDVLRNFYRSKDTRLPELQRAVAEHAVPADVRLMSAQDLAWGLLNSREFLFNH